jgi:hypothetical protein
MGSVTTHYVVIICSGYGCDRIVYVIPNWD